MSIFKEELISFETAKSAKEKGFDEICAYLWNFPRSNKLESCVNQNSDLNKGRAWYSAPTQSLLQKWMWETYTIHISIVPVKHRGYPHIRFQFRLLDFRTVLIDDEVLYEHQYNTALKEYDSPKEALEKGLQEALKLIP